MDFSLRLAKTKLRLDALPLMTTRDFKYIRTSIIRNYKLFKLFFPQELVGHHILRNVMYTINVDISINIYIYHVQLYRNKYNLKYYIAMHISGDQ